MKEAFLAKWKRLFEKDTPFKQRLLVSGILGIVFGFTFLLMGPIELTVSNHSVLNFSFLDILFDLLLVWIAVAALLTGLGLLLNGRIYRIYCSVLFSVTFIGYLQGNFLNINLGLMDGSSIPWQSYKAHAIGNLAIWVAAIILPLILLYFSRNIWKKVLIFCCAAILLMQATGLVFLFVNAPEDAYVKADQISTDLFLTTDDMMKLSPDKNIVVLLLDYFDNVYLEEILADNPDFLEPLSGFTRYTNVVGSTGRTYPFVPCFLTGEKWDYKIPVKDYLKNSYANGTFLPDLKEAGFERNLYLTGMPPVVVGKFENLIGLADNLVESDRENSDMLDRKGILLDLYSLSAFRYVPHAMKSNFSMYTDDINNHVKSARYFLSDDLWFYNRLIDERLSLQEGDNTFAYYHLRGPHRPYVIDENLQPVEESSAYEQGIASFKIAFEYISQMKELGVFDNATVIIMADHGKYFDTLDWSKPPTPILFVKPSGVTSDQPLKNSSAPVSHADLHPTILYEAGGDYRKYGKTIYEYSEGEQRVREFLNNITIDEEPDAEACYYEIDGDANSKSNWELVFKEEIIYSTYGNKAGG